MKTVRIVSKALFVLTRLFTLGYFLSLLLSILAFSTGWSFNILNNNTRFQILFPFTNTPFLLGEYNSGFIYMFLLFFFLYTLFFWLLENVFRVFMQTKLFTKEGIRRLKMFYISNLSVPLLAIISLSVFYEVDPTAQVLVILHAVLGIFAYFIAAIFQQGLHLQNEQDLII